MPEKFVIDDSMVLPPAPEGAEVEVVRGPNIKPFPINQALADKVSGKALIKVGDNITTGKASAFQVKCAVPCGILPYTLRP